MSSSLPLGCGPPPLPPPAPMLLPLLLPGLPDWLARGVPDHALALLLSPRAGTRLRDLPRPAGGVLLLAGPEGGYDEIAVRIVRRRDDDGVESAGIGKESACVRLDPRDAVPGRRAARRLRRSLDDG